VAFISCALYSFPIILKNNGFKSDDFRWSRKLMSTSTQINAAVKALGLPLCACRPLLEAEAKAIYGQALHHFVAGGDRRWWWEAFIGVCVSRKCADGWQRLAELTPDPNSLVWFVVEDVESPFCPVYEATPWAIEKIIGECSAFEYYLVAKDMRWLLCENHHNILIGVGEPVISRWAHLRWDA
jgi:hypothetical protein